MENREFTRLTRIFSPALQSVANLLRISESPEGRAYPGLEAAGGYSIR
jgi:hypothetical protein